MTAFTDRLAAILGPKLAALGVPSSALPAFVAQIDVETTGGTSKNVTARHNFAGIRGGTVTTGNTRGYRIYPNDTAGLDAYVALLQRSYGSVLDTARRTGDPYKTAVALGNSRWAATGYRLGADGTNDKAGDAGVKLGKPGTEGQALFPRIKQLTGKSSTSSTSSPDRGIDAGAPMPKSSGGIAIPMPGGSITPGALANETRAGLDGLMSGIGQQVVRGGVALVVTVAALGLMAGGLVLAVNPKGTP